MNPKRKATRSLSAARRKELLEVLEYRFDTHPERHAGLKWAEVLARLDLHPEKLRSLEAMELSGGEPDVVRAHGDAGEIAFFDCSPQTPKDRTSVCYDRKGLESRKEHKPADTAMDMAAAMGIEMLTEEQYLQLQTVGEFDTKTSSWLKTPDDFRNHGGALYGERRYDRVFIGHNGAQSYYSARGFRGCLKI
jgi:hypothetical protein